MSQIVNDSTIISLQSSKEGDNTTGSDFIGSFKEKPVRLFGFEIEPSGANELSSSRSSSGGDESPNTSKDTISSKRLPLKVGNTVSKKFKCQSCLKAFGSSQALGGHQNAHKKHKIMKSNKKIQPKAHHDSGPASSWCFDQCGESQISFSSSDPIWWVIVKAKTQQDSSQVFSLTTSDEDLKLLGSTKSYDKFLDLQLSLSLLSNPMFS